MTITLAFIAGFNIRNALSNFAVEGQEFGGWANLLTGIAALVAAIMLP